MPRLRSIALLGGTALALSIVGCSDQSDPIAPATPTASEIATPSNESKLLKVASANRIPDSYIVVFRNTEKNTAGKAAEMGRRHGFQNVQVFEHAVKGFAAKISDSRVRELLADPDVAYVEPDQVIHATAQTLPWGISATGADSSSTLAGNGSGTVTGVRIYIIDSGIQTNHSDLNVVGGYNFTGGSATAYGDGNGHGTHVAGTAAARDNGSGVVGVAPGAPLYAVRVLNNTGSGTSSGVLAGVNWVRQQKLNNPSVPMVANMSLGGGASTALDQAVNSLITAGVVVCVASGNDGINAANSSPARVAAAITVGAHQSNQTIASFSNYGSVVDILAPGVGITSTYLNGTMASMNGTSMATPHVAGAAALYLSRAGNVSPAAVRTALVNASQPWINIGTRTGTTNRTLRVTGF